MKAELTEQEARVARLLGDLWNEYLQLPVEHPMEREEFCKAVHVCQDIVLSRCGRRALQTAGVLP